MNKTEAKQRMEVGRQAAEAASNNGEIQLEEKPYGQTSDKNYPYTYWYVKGWNEFVAEQTEG